MSCFRSRVVSGILLYFEKQDEREFIPIHPNSFQDYECVIPCQALAKAKYTYRYVQPKPLIA